MADVTLARFNPVPAVSGVAVRAGRNGEDAHAGDEHLALLLSVKEYGAVLPWIAGMAIALISVWERIRQRQMA